MYIWIRRGDWDWEGVLSEISIGMKSCIPSSTGNEGENELKMPLRISASYSRSLTVAYVVLLLVGNLHWAIVSSELDVRTELETAARCGNQLLWGGNQPSRDREYAESDKKRL